MIPSDDLKDIKSNLIPVIKKLNGKKIFITGATGFLGKWILLSLYECILASKIDCQLIVLSRDPDSFLEKHKFTFSPNIVCFLKGEISNFTYEPVVDHILHMATNADPELNFTQPEQQYQEIINGMINILEFAKNKKIKKFLFTSSGAVYGEHNSKVTENHLIEKSSVQTSYAKAKAKCEELASKYSKDYGFIYLNARCFTFMGPFMPLSLSFAAGNFIKSAINGNNISIKGNGLSTRSYMYMSDFAIALLLVFLNSEQNIIYNVGSDEKTTIEDLARLIAKHNKNINVDILNEINGQSFYCPNIDRLRNEMKFILNNTLEDSIHKTVSWFQSNKKMDT